jgi:UDP-GlcNAc:undecaprenyl-phosphate/decaprenyl-phosphate GlcNAc-1-phosphate transferase
MLKSILLYSIISFFILIIFSKISYIFNLVDMPNKRKKHLKPTAFTGGLILSFIYIASIFIFEINSEKLNLTLSFGFLITIVGFIDDKYNLNFYTKLSLQIIPIIYLIFLENFNLIDIGEYNYFKLELNSFAIPFTLLSILFLINAFNYFDGSDGTLTLTTISVLCILYFLSNDENDKLFLIIIFLPLLLFLFFNFSTFKLPKLFLGDGGSLLLGFVISFTLIYFANYKSIHPILLAWSVAIIVFEFLSLNIIRLKNNKNLFLPGNDHLHYILLKNTKSLFQTNLFIFLANIIFFIIGYMSFIFISPLISLILFISLFLIYLTLRKKF